MNKDLLQELVAASKKHTSTEEFLLYVAAEDGILELCHKLLDEGRQNSELLLQLAELCGEYSVNLGNLLQNIKEVVRALSPNNHEITDAYATLGLEDSAALEEVKKAFRKQCMQYHPDHSEGVVETERFLKIRNAYTSITDDISFSSTQQATPWTQSASRSHARQSEKSKKFVYTIAAILTLLLLASLFLANKHKQRALQQRSELFTSRQEKSIKKNVVLPDASVADKVEQIENVPARTLDVTFQELEVAIPPDPILLATLEHPFPFRTDPGASLKKEKKTIKKSDQDNKAQGALLEEKIKALEQKIREMEQQTIEKTEVKSEPIEKQDPPQKTPPSEAYQKTAQIREFLDLYTEIYTDRNVDKLMKLFMPDALENGTPVNTLVDTYSNLFQKTNAIRMKIFNFQWKEYLNDLQVHGYFDAEYTYKTGSTKKYFGEVTFHLTSLKSDELRIKKFTYTLSE